MRSDTALWESLERELMRAYGASLNARLFQCDVRRRERWGAVVVAVLLPLSTRQRSGVGHMGNQRARTHERRRTHTAGQLRRSHKGRARTAQGEHTGNVQRSGRHRRRPPPSRAAPKSTLVSRSLTLHHTPMLLSNSFSVIFT